MDEARKQTQAAEYKKLQATVDEIRESTKTKKSLAINLGAGLLLAVGVWYFQPIADKLFKRVPEKNVDIMTAPSHQYHFHYHEAPRTDKKETDPKEPAPMQKQFPVLVRSR